MHHINHKLTFIIINMPETLYTVCKSFTYSDAYRNYFSLSPTEALVIQIISPFAFVSCILNIAFFLKIPNSRQPPFDVLLFLSVFSLLNIIVNISTVIYNAFNPIDIDNPINVPSDFNSFCLATGTMKFSAQIGAFTYNIIFCFYYTFKIKNPLKGWAKQNNQVHFLCLVIILIATITIYFLQEIGVSPFGVCGLIVSVETFFGQLAIDITYVSILIITSVIFLKYLSKLSKFDYKASVFYKYYLVYTFIISINYLLQSITLTVIIVDCYTGLSQSVRIALTQMTNILVLILPITITFIIWFHPEARKSVKTYIYYTLKKNRKAQSRDSYYDEQPNQNQNNKSSRQPILIQLKQLNQLGNGFISGLKQRNKVSLLSTILGCISMQARELKQNGKMLNRSSLGSFQEDHIFSWNMKDRYQIDIDESLVRSEPDCFVQHIPAVYMKFISYSSSTFQYLMALDGIDFLDKSTNPSINLANIYDNAQTDGGRSGQFFFFTTDNRIILKTLNKKELNVMLQKIENYYQHFRANQNSLIVKIYGLFSTVNSQTHEQLHFMLMGNLCDEIPRKFVKRVYDMKGSTHQRQVFTQNQLQNMKDDELNKKTMKDVDFDSLQRKINIDPEISAKIVRILKKDADFFEYNGLIDYSLIVIIIDYYSYAQSLDLNQKSCFESRKMFRSQQDPNFVYIFGIIDYLETWNIKKKGEKWYKSIWTKAEGISSQSPAYYARRFYNNLVLKIFP